MVNYIAVYAITLHDGVVYAGTSEGMFALWASDGREIWRTDNRGPFSSTPAVVDGVMYIGSGEVTRNFAIGYSDDSAGKNGHIHAFDAATGREIWSFPTGAWLDSSPAVVDGVLYIGCRDKNLYALDASNGRKLWTFATPAWVDSSPAVVDGIDCFLGANSLLYALDANSGSMLWSLITENHGEWFASSPAVAGEVIYCIHGNNVTALEARAGKVIWSFSPGDDDWIDSSPRVDNGTVYLSGGRFAWALDAATGAVRWTLEYESRGGGNVSCGNYDDPPPAVADGVVYMTNIRGQLLAINARTGKPTWSLDLGGYVRSSPVVVRGRVFVGIDNGPGRNYSGRILALDAKRGEQRWAFRQLSVNQNTVLFI